MLHTELLHPGPGVESSHGRGLLGPLDDSPAALPYPLSFRFKA